MVAMVGIAGASVDYTRANSVRTAMQAAVDATALSLAKDARTLTGEQLGQQATSIFMTAFHRPEAKNVTVTPQFSSPQPGTFVLSVAATASIDTTLTQLLGQSQLNIAASGEVVWGFKKLELALVLDNTGSMAQSGKLAALKTAAHNLLDILQQATNNPGDIKVAIVPFDTTVNIGTGYANEPWIDYSVKNIDPNHWHGCVIDRDQPNDTLDTTPTTTNYHTLYPAAGCGSLAQALPLTGDWTTLGSKIDQMVASGNTDIALGLVWGWHALTANLPLTEAAAPAPDLDKVIVLLTDGENTQNRWSTRASAIDPRTSAVCTNIKAAGIKIYAVRVVDGNASLLQGCATTPSMYYDVQQASQLDSVFTSIAQSLATLRISK
jgi:Flp pilus assembly protein TadG